VRKRHGTRWHLRHLGRITNRGADAENSEVTWKVKHQGGENSDYNLAEIAEILLPKGLVQHLKTPENGLAPLLRKCMGELHARHHPPGAGFFKMERISVMADGRYSGWAMAVTADGRWPS
jgi:hypothetical protein